MNGISVNSGNFKVSEIKAILSTVPSGVNRPRSEKSRLGESLGQDTLHVG